MRVVLDMDGVVVDLLPTWLKLINRYYGENLYPEGITSYDIAKHCTRATPEQVYRFFKEPGFFRHLPPKPGALEGIQKIITQGDEVVFATACTHGHEDKRAWIESHLPFFDLRNLVFAHRKELIKGDLFVDDCIKNLNAYQSTHPDAMIVCFNAPYNQEYQGFRVSSWDEFLAMPGVSNGR